MRKVRTATKPVSFFLSILMIVICTPHQMVLAKMVTTETIIDAARVNDARAVVNAFIAREDVANALVFQGIDRHEALLRVNTLSDTEIVSLADRMENLPAGSGTFEFIVIIGLIVFLVLLATDVAGYTDIFPFVKK